MVYVELPRYPHPHSVRGTYSQTPSTDTEGGIESVRIKRVEFRENIKALFPQGQTKLSVIVRCPYKAGVRKMGLTVP